MADRRHFIQQSAALALGSVLGPVSLKAAPLPDQNDVDYWEKLRKQFSLKEGQTYFNNATMGPVPDPVIRAMIGNMEFNAVHGAETDYKGEGPQLLTGYFPEEEVRMRLAAIINCDFREIVLTQNATFGMNYVANGLDLKEGDELINTNQEHGGGFAAWQLLAKRRGCIYKQAEIPVPANDAGQIIDSIFRQVTPRTKVIAVPHIISVYGVVMPVKEICQEARRRGIFTILDGAQAVGQVKVDMQDIGCDAYYTSLHKWFLAPGGNGLLYIQKDRMPEVWSTIASYNWENEEDHGFRLMQNGTGNTALLAGLNASVDFFEAVGEDRWLKRILGLANRLRDGLQEMDHITIFSPMAEGMCAGMTTYIADGFTGPELQKHLWNKGKLQPRSVGKEYLRHSVHIYNSEAEVDRTLEILRAVKG